MTQLNLPYITHLSPFWGRTPKSLCCSKRGSVHYAQWPIHRPLQYITIIGRLFCVRTNVEAYMLTNRYVARLALYLYTICLDIYRKLFCAYPLILLVILIPCLYCVYNFARFSVNFINQHFAFLGVFICLDS